MNREENKILSSIARRDFLVSGPALLAALAGGAADVVVSRSRRVAAVMVPLPGTGIDARTLSALAIIRSRVLAQARRARVVTQGHRTIQVDFPESRGDVFAYQHCRLLQGRRRLQILPTVRP